jgi:hypothetical protein
MIIQTAVAILTFAFPGGDEADYAKCIAKTFDVSVVMFVDGESRWRQTTIKDRRESSTKLRSLTTFRRSGTFNDEDRLWSVWPRSWPFHFAHKQNVHSYLGRFLEQTSEFRLSSSRFTFEPKSVHSSTLNPHSLGRLSTFEALTLDDCSKLKLEKPVLWHWYFDEARLLVRANNAPLKPLWKAIAQSVGGTWVERDSSYFIDLDVKEFRKRWTNMAFDSDLANSPFWKRQFVLTNAVFGAMSDQALRKLLETRTGRVELEAKPGTALRTAAEKYVRVHLAEAYKQGRAHPDFEKIDLDAGIVCFSNSMSTADVKVFSKDRKYKFVF